MAIKRKDGFYVVQVLFRAEEYEGEFKRQLKASGLTESSFLRVGRGFPSLKEKSKGSAKKRRGSAKRARAGTEGKGAAASPAAAATKSPAGVPFVGHREEEPPAAPEPAAEPAAAIEERPSVRVEELIDESGIEGLEPAAEEREGGGEVEIELFGEKLEV